jgi:DNA-binding NarL/FixJ family response regulator
MKQDGKTRILIVDDHPVLRQGLRQLIEVEDDLEVCGEAESLQEGRAAVEELAPDLAIVDIALRDSDGLELVRRIRSQHPAVSILVLSMLNERLYAEHSLRAGAHGYLMKGEAPETALAAIRRILDGGMYISENMQSVWLQRGVGRGQDPLALPIESLTDRELNVLRLIGEGHGPRHIADELTLSVKTVESHRDNIRHKLGLENSAELIQYATLWLERAASGD